MEQRLPGEGTVRWRAQPEAAADELDRALCVVEVIRSCRTVPRGFLRGTRQRDRQAPPLANCPGIVAITLADLEDRDVLPAMSQVRRDDLDQAPGDRWTEDGVIG